MLPIMGSTGSNPVLTTCVVPLRKDLLEYMIKDTIYGRQLTTQRVSHSQHSQVAELEDATRYGSTEGDGICPISGK